MIKRFALVCAVAAAIAGLFGACAPKEEAEMPQYLVLFYTNTVWQDVVADWEEVKSLFGENDPESGRMYAVGFVGPNLLTQSKAQMAELVNAAFDYAEEHNIPVYFNLDDNTNYYIHAAGEYFGKGTEVKYWEHPEMCEWTDFPGEDEEFGGQFASEGRLPRFWYNWGQTRVAEAVPNLASPEFLALISDKLENGVLKPLTERYEKLKSEGKEWLFAGLSAGWETHIPDYSANNIFADPLRDTPCADTGAVMEWYEMRQYGYGALTSLGYDQEKLDTEAQERGISSGEYMRELLYGVIHDYIEGICRQINEAGIPRELIYTHIVSLSTVREEESTFFPPVWTAVNGYSVPGFTMSQISCPYNMEKILSEIKKADPDQKYFANTEGYGSGPVWSEDWSERGVAVCDAYFEEMFGNGARVVTAYGYPDDFESIYRFHRVPDFPYVISANKWLRGETVK